MSHRNPTFQQPSLVQYLLDSYMNWFRLQASVPLGHNMGQVLSANHTSKPKNQS